MWLSSLDEIRSPGPQRPPPSETEDGHPSSCPQLSALRLCPCCGVLSALLGECGWWEDWLSFVKQEIQPLKSQVWWGEDWKITAKFEADLLRKEYRWKSANHRLLPWSCQGPCTPSKVFVHFWAMWGAQPCSTALTLDLQALFFKSWKRKFLNFSHKAWNYLAVNLRDLVWPSAWVTALFYLGIQPFPEGLEPIHSRKEGSEDTSTCGDRSDSGLMFPGYLSSFIFWFKHGLNWLCCRTKPMEINRDWLLTEGSSTEIVRDPPLVAHMLPGASVWHLNETDCLLSPGFHHIKAQSCPQDSGKLFSCD